MSNGSYPTGLLFPTLDDTDFQRRVQYGDSTLGWVGNENFWVEAHGDRVCVLGLDRFCEPYVAAEVNRRLDPGWQHTLIRKLRDGDWRRPDSGIDFVAEASRRQAEHDKQMREYDGRIAERLAWMLRRVWGPKVDGLSRDVFPLSGPRGGW